jgi:hypothetical protein
VGASQAHGSPVDGLTLGFMMGSPGTDVDVTVADSQRLTECEERCFATVNYDYSHSRIPQMGPRVAQRRQGAPGGQGLRDFGSRDERQDRYWIPLRVDYEGSHVGRLDPPLPGGLSLSAPMQRTSPTKENEA